VTVSPHIAIEADSSAAYVSPPSSISPPYASYSQSLTIP
jgi:hypothetical protein